MYLKSSFKRDLRKEQQLSVLLDSIYLKHYPKKLRKLLNTAQEHHGKIEMKGLDSKKEGYLYCSARNKAEKPINLILKLDLLIEKGIAKPLV